MIIITCEKGHLHEYSRLALPAGDLRYWKCPYCGCGCEKVERKLVEELLK